MNRATSSSFGEWIETTTHSDPAPTYTWLKYSNASGTITAPPAMWADQTVVFDYEAAREMYEDDPVVLAILDRMEKLERAY